MSEEFATVSVKQGALKGRRCRAPGGNAYVSFEGVPYAKPPVGALRFKNTQPSESWTGIWDATKPRNPCLQFDVLAKQIVGDEDCLYLNVYTQDLPTESKSTSLRPVMIYVHGGGFSSGYGHLYNTEPFMEKDVVCVTFNYRVGPLGFLGAGSLDVPGNAGLKDQVMAFRWVKENIAAFGGDPGNVTIFGESAGGASVHYQMLSPLSKGLFQRVISQSGNALDPWTLNKDPVGSAQRLALATGCPPDAATDTAALVRWLRQVPAEKLVYAVGDSAKEEEENGKLLFLPFVPCVEPDHPGAFIIKEPAAVLASGEAHRLPLICGLTSHEGIMLLPSVMRQLSSYRAPPGGVMPTPEEMEAAAAEEMAMIAADPGILLSLSAPSEHRPEIAQRLKDFYFDGKPPTENIGLVDVFTDLFFALGMLEAARQHARLGSPVYIYEFAFNGRNNFLSGLLHSKVKGVCHADELAYLFNMPETPVPEENSPEALVKKRMLQMWTNFAKSGDPTPHLDGTIKTKWLPFSESAPHYLKIDEELKADTSLFKDRMSFWKDVLTRSSS